MTYRLTRLLNLTVAAGDDRYPVRTLLCDPAGWRLRHAALDIGGWWNRHDVVVSLSRLGRIDAAEGLWHAPELTRDEIEAAARWSGEGAPLEGLSLWPPLIVGPFGGTYAPLLMQSLWNEEMADVPESEAEPPSHRTDARDWIGRDAFGDDGLLGRIEDVEVTEDTYRFVAVVIGGEGMETGRTVPLTALRYLADQGHAVFDLDRAALAAM
ncbi:PRC-barrel domain containing protein [Mesobaculum littorinae]|uniref:PRC-barrel domain containing protein n=1 Tax=Mesobaculum littorinae TaxID=2486419 RepID=A0A438AHG2_9RHOB|nr:PRC-barrel domain-containing protein [Mesobaculum littorinae]RVV98169.1 PRC-barrel domain containing protein [Mesobaculum littorinae]